MQKISNLFSLNQLKSDFESPPCLTGEKFNLSHYWGSPLQGLYKVLGSYLAPKPGRDPTSCQPTLVTTEMSTDPIQHSPATACSPTHSGSQTANFFIFSGNFLLFPLSSKASRILSSVSSGFI